MGCPALLSRPHSFHLFPSDLLWIFSMGTSLKVRRTNAPPLVSEKAGDRGYKEKEK